MISEEEQFKILLDRNPHPGIPFKEEEYKDYVVEKANRNYFKVFGWVINSSKLTFSPKSNIIKFLKAYDISFQVYYDIVVLGLTSPDQRPKCPICGKVCKFSYKTKSYLSYCDSLSCKQKVKFDVIDRTVNKSEEDMFYELLNKNPNKGLKYNDYLLEENNNKYIKIYKWLSNREDEFFVEISKLGNWLRKFGTTVQIYYDIIVLGLIDIKDRPKCSECNNISRFSGITAGYLKTCSPECYERSNRNHIKTLGLNSKGRILSEVTKEKIRKVKTGVKYSEESSYKKSIKMINWLSNNGGMSSRKYKRGNYVSEIFNKTFHFDSSWERFFIQEMEKSTIRKDIITFDRCKESVEYVKDDGSRHRYLPDFDILLKNGTRVIVEIKPINILKKDRVVLLKRIAGKKHFEKQKNTLYIVLTENELYKNINGSFWLYDYLLIN